MERRTLLYYGVPIQAIFALVEEEYLKHRTSKIARKYADDSADNPINSSWLSQPKSRWLDYLPASFNNHATLRQIQTTSLTHLQDG